MSSYQAVKPSEQIQEGVFLPKGHNDVTHFRVVPGLTIMLRWGWYVPPLGNLAVLQSMLTSE